MENPVARAKVQLPVWAGRKIQNMDVELFEAQFDLKLHVYALGGLVEINAAQCRAWCTYLWTSSRVPSPAAIAPTVAGAVGGAAAVGTTAPALPVLPDPVVANPMEVSPVSRVGTLAWSGIGSPLERASLQQSVTTGSHKDVVDAVESVTRGFQHAIDKMAGHMESHMQTVAGQMAEMRAETAAARTAAAAAAAPGKDADEGGIAMSGDKLRA